MKKLTLLLFASLLFFTTASYAQNEDLVAKVAEVKSKLKKIHDSNTDLKKTLASYENEITGLRLALENFETKISRMEEEQGSDKVFLFFESEFVGCSPDGLVNDNGVIEIKSVISNVHYLNVKRQKVDPAYRWQCIGNLKFTGRDWLDFISYCSTYPEGKQIFIHRIRKEDLTEEFKMIDDRVAEFKKLVEECKAVILDSKYDNY